MHNYTVIILDNTNQSIFDDTIRLRSNESHANITLDIHNLLLSELCEPHTIIVKANNDHGRREGNLTITENNPIGIIVILISFT